VSNIPGNHEVKELQWTALHTYFGKCKHRKVNAGTSDMSTRKIYVRYLSCLALHVK